MTKLIQILFALLFLFTLQQVKAQTLNWASLDNTKHIANVNLGIDYSVSYGIGYGYKLNTKLPIVLNVHFSKPAGENQLDDFKTKIGGQTRFYTINNFHFSASVYGIYRRYENSSVRMQNFGSEMTGIIGYYKPKWFVAGEFGFDKAIVTHFKHSQEYKDNVYSEVIDGWYQPSTGGNFSCGLQTGISFKRSDITLKGGYLNTQDFKSTPTLPLYFQLGYNYKIGRK
jgi:hypothetical protein